MATELGLELVDSVQAGAQRLLDQQVHSGLGELEGHRNMEIGRRGDDGRVVSVRQGGPQIRIYAADPVLAGDPLPKLGVGVAERQANASGGLKTPQVTLADRSDADDQHRLGIRHAVGSPVVSPPSADRVPQPPW